MPSIDSTERLSIETTHDTYGNRDVTLYFLKTEQGKLPIATVINQHQPQTAIDLLKNRVRAEKHISVQVEPRLAGVALDALVDYLTIYVSNSIVTQDMRLGEAQTIEEVARALAEYAIRAAVVKPVPADRAT